MLMKTNQLMTVNFGEYKFHIYHKDGLGSLNELVDIGNNYRNKKGQKPILMRDLLRRNGIFEYIIMFENKLLTKCGEKPHFDNQRVTKVKYSENIDDFKDKSGKLVLPKNLNVLKRKKGANNGGTYAHLNILIRVAMDLSAELADDVIQTFVDGRLLELRDMGGDTFKKLQATLKEYIRRNYNREPISSDYIRLAKFVKDTIEIENWNVEPRIKHKFRIELHEMLMYIYSGEVLDNIVISKLLDSVESRYKPKNLN